MPATPLVIESPYSFFYSAEGPVTATALAESLIGLEGMAERAAFALRTLAPNIGRVKAQLLVHDVAIGSYKENFLFRLVLGRGDDAERKLDDLRRKLHLDGVNAPTIVTSALVAGIVCYGVWQFAKPDPSASTFVNNGFLAIGSSINMPPDEFTALLDKSTPNKEDLRRDTVRIVRPAGLKQAGTMTLKAGDLTVSLPHQALATVPIQYTKGEPEILETKLSKVPAIIRALDLDRVGQGWAGVLPETSETRMPVELGDGVSPAAIPPGKIIYADVTLIQGVDRRGQKIPKRFISEKIHPFDGSQY